LMDVELGRDVEPKTEKRRDRIKVKN